MRVDDVKELKATYESKYVQSYLGDTFKKIKKDLNNNKKVLFVGTSCQVYGLKAFLSHDNLITIDILCLGVSSPGIFKRYLEYLEDKYNSRILEYHFRSKYYGYSTSNIDIVFHNKILRQHYDCKCLASTFFDGYNMRPSCYSCEFREKDRPADFTIGDFHNIGDYSKELDDDKGTTKVWINSIKGKGIFDSLSDKINYIYIEDTVSSQIGGSKNQIGIPYDRDMFFEDYRIMDFSEFILKWQPNTLKKKVVCILRKLIKFIPFKSYITKYIRKKQYYSYGNKGER